MDIKEINKKYYDSSELNDARQRGISSSIYSYINGVMYIKVFINSKWKKNYQVTAFEVAHNWRNNIPELKKAIGAKVFILDLEKQVNDKLLLQKGHINISHARKGILFMNNQLN